MTKFKLFLATLLFGVSTSVFADVTEIGNQALQKLLDEGVAVVDVRRLDEWQQTGVIDGAHLLTFFDKQGRYNAKQWLDELAGIAPNGAPVVLICARGVRSKSIAKLLDKQLGFEGVHNHTRGMLHWIDKGLPVVPYPAQLKK